MKKIITLLLAAALIAALGVSAAAAGALPQPDPALDGATHAHDGVAFRNNPLLGSSYYLTEDLDLSEVNMLPPDLTVPADMKLNLCLNGFTLKAPLDMIVKGNVNIYDCVGTGVLDVTGGSITVAEGGSFAYHCDSITVIGDAPPLGIDTDPFTPPPVTPTPEPAGTVSVRLDEKVELAWVEGDWTDLYARAALVIDAGGQSGLYATQVPINDDGSILVPVFMVPGLTVKGVSIALVSTLEDITSPTPKPIASDFVIF